jgi:hypothetical protein
MVLVLAGLITLTGALRSYIGYMAARIRADDSERSQIGWERESCWSCARCQKTPSLPAPVKARCSHRNPPLFCLLHTHIHFPTYHDQPIPIPLPLSRPPQSNCRYRLSIRRPRSRPSQPSHFTVQSMAEQLESKTAIMLDQAQVDAAEAAADAQENGENGEHIGRRPSSSGRDSKRYRKSSFVCRTSFFSSAPPRPNAATCRTPLYASASFTHHSAAPPPTSHTHSLFLPFFLLRNQLGCNTLHSNPPQHMRQPTPRAVTFQQGLCNG